MTIPDVLPADGRRLRVLFCGINPGLMSAATGHHFARPGNRFWPALHRAGFTPRQLLPAEQWQLPDLGLGITNVAPRPTARADELSRDELVEGGLRLVALVRRVRPAWLAVVGVTAYRVAFAEPRAAVGRQDHAIPLDSGPLGPGPLGPGPLGSGPLDPGGATRVWVLPNPSGLNAHWPLPALAAEFARLRAAAMAPSPSAG